MSFGFKRVLLKLSGEALMGPTAFGWHAETVSRIVEDVLSVRRDGVEVCIVVGGGNLFRGATGGPGFDRRDADCMGMLATVMNAIALKNFVEAAGVCATVQSAVDMGGLCEGFVPARAREQLAAGCVVIFGGGTGNPFFTTDTAAALRALEMRCDAMCKGTQVDGVYSADPRRDPQATRYAEVSFGEALSKDLRVMDAAAMALAKDHALPILVFSIQRQGAFADAVAGRGTFTIMR